MTAPADNLARTSNSLYTRYQPLVNAVMATLVTLVALAILSSFALLCFGLIYHAVHG